MAKSLIYTANTTSTAVPIGNTVPVGSIIHRYGPCIDATGSAINVKEPGYYLVNISATFTAAAAGNVTLTLQRDGVAVSGATATETIATAATESANVGITAIVRVMCCGNARLSVLVDGTAAPTITNMAIGVVKA
nr:MAG TPA: BclA protein [Caudoviricetes sp.]